MLSIYLGSLLFGGVLLGASIFGGHGDGAGHDGDGDGQGGGHDGDTHGDDAGHHGHHHLQLPFFSLRFWAFALAFFGLSGAALTFGGGLAAAAVPFIAGGVGLGCGYLSARVLQGLARRPVGLLGSGEGHIGREGRVLLPVEKGRRGKVRLSIAGASTDVIAETEGEGALAPGETALIVGMRGTVALVERSPASLPPLGGVTMTKTEDS